MWKAAIFDIYLAIYNVAIDLRSSGITKMAIYPWYSHILSELWFLTWLLW